MFIASKVIYLMLEKEIEGETLNLNFFAENGYKRGWRLSNAYQFYQSKIRRITNGKKESKLRSYLN